jgi:hypothetical protein
MSDAGEYTYDGGSHVQGCRVHTDEALCSTYQFGDYMQTGLPNQIDEPWMAFQKIVTDISDLNDVTIVFGEQSTNYV